MGTRGAVGFVVDGEEKVAYNHWDSYPGGLGQDVLSFLRSRNGDWNGLRQAVRSLRVVTDEEPPTPDDILRLAKHSDTDVSTGDLNEWYVLLRDTMGDLDKILEAGVLEDASRFPLDSLFCEWAYIINLDNEVLGVYKGFQKEQHTEGRYADRIDESNRGYWPVRLVATFPLDRLPSHFEDFEVGEG